MNNVLGVIPGNLYILGIIISISFFTLGIYTSRSNEKGFEGFFYLIISAMSTCMVARWSVSTVSFIGTDYSLPVECGWLIAIIGLMIGTLSTLKLIFLENTENDLPGRLMCSLFVLMPSIIYIYLPAGVLSPFIGVVDDADHTINIFVYFFGAFIILYLLCLFIEVSKWVYTFVADIKRKE